MERSAVLRVGNHYCIICHLYICLFREILLLSGKSHAEFWKLFSVATMAVSQRKTGTKVLSTISSEECHSNLLTTTLKFITLQGKSPLASTQWLRVVLDEGHVIRNPSAMMSKAVHALKSERRWVVTGTPIQNSMKDMFSIISFLKLEPFTDRQWWRRTMERPISEGDQGALRYWINIAVLKIF